MIAVSYYLLKVVLCSGVLAGYYWMALRNKLFHQWNRFYILVALLLSTLIPLFNFEFAAKADEKPLDHVIRLVSEGADYIAVPVKQQTVSVTTNQVISILYLSVSAFLLFISLLFILRLYRLLQTHTQQKIDKAVFINTEVEGTPFSFFRYIFWNKKIELTTENGQQILRHELVHVQQKHSYDKMICQLLLIFYWINPFFWLFKKELYHIHEFIADQKSCNDFDTENLAQMILASAYPNQFQNFSNPFFQSSIKRRLMMLTKNKNPKMNYAARVIALPLLVFVGFAFTVKINKIKIAASSEKSESVPNNTQNNRTVFSDKIITANPKKTTAVKKTHFNSKKDTVPVKEVVVQGYKILPDDSMTLHIKSASFEDIKNFKGTIAIDGKRFQGTVNNLPLRLTDIYSISIGSGSGAIKEIGVDTRDGILIIETKQHHGTNNLETHSAIFTKTDVAPKFAGNWPSFLRQNLNADIPVINKAPAGAYTVVAQFIVDRDGKLSDIKTLTNNGYGMEEEVVRVLKISSPNWLPAMQNGRKVKAFHSQNFTFVVPKE